MRSIERLESRIRRIVFLQRELRNAGKKSRALRERRIASDGFYGCERLLVIALLDVHVPERQARAIEGRHRLERRVQITDRGGGRLGEQPFDEVFEHVEWRMG